MNDQSDSATTSPSQSTDVFGEGDLGRIQGILLGDHAKRTNERIDTLEKALLGAISDLKSEMTSALGDLAKRIDAEEKNRTTGIANLSDRFKTSTKSTTTELKSLQSSLEKSQESLTTRIDEATGDQRLELDAVRRDLSAEIETTETDITNRTVDRLQLASLMEKLAAELSR